MDAATAWKKAREWCDRNFTWKGVVLALFALYQLIPDTAGRNQYWISMYPTIRDFVLHHLRPVLIVLCGLLIWLDHRRTLAKHRPHKSGLVLSIGTAIWAADVENNRTVFVLSATLINTGEPTITKWWKAEYEYNGIKEPMEGFWVKDSYTITVKDESLTIENKHLLNAQTLTNRVETGDARVGRLLFVIKGDRSAQTAALQFKVHLSCGDYADRESTALFAPSSLPMETMKMFPGEVVNKKVQKPATPALDSIPKLLPESTKGSN